MCILTWSVCVCILTCFVHLWCLYHVTQTMFREKHGRDATPEEVELWMDAVSGLATKLSGVSVEDVHAEGVADEIEGDVVEVNSCVEDSK